MAVKKDYYEILGINKDADEAAIKKAYRKLAKQYHPDTNTGDVRAEQKFKEATEAYTMLSDPEKKKMYDQFGHAAFDGSAADAGAYGGTGGAYREYQFQGGDRDDIFGDIFGDIFREAGEGGPGGHSFHGSGFGSHGFDRTSFARKGRDVRAEVTVSFDEAVYGCDKIISLQNMERADGMLTSLQVHIPAGIETGKSIRLQGKGMPGMNGGESGDLLLKLKVGEKIGYERKGMDVYTTAAIPFTTAVFGGEVRVQTLYGDVMCKIREGTQSGSKIRLKGKGIVSMKNKDVYGDQYVSIQIQVPKELSRDARQKLKEYAQVCSESGNRRKQANRT